MASLSEDPSLSAAKQSARRDWSMLSKAYRQAKRTGDFERALQLAQYGDKSGLPIGRTANDKEIAGAGMARYELDLKRSGTAPKPGGLAGFDFRQAKDRGELFAGEGFEQVSKMPQQAPRQIASGGSMDQGQPMPGGAESQQGSLLPPPVNAPAQPSAGQQLAQRPVDMFRSLWNEAKTQEEKDQIVEDAYAQGVPLSDMGRQIIENRRTKSFFQQVPQQPQTQAPAALGQNMYAQPGVGGAFASLLRRNKNPLTSRI